MRMKIPQKSDGCYVHKRSGGHRSFRGHESFREHKTFCARTLKVHGHRSFGVHRRYGAPKMVGVHNGQVPGRFWQRGQKTGGI